jgi:hypothetical protein
MKIRYLHISVDQNGLFQIAWNNGYWRDVRGGSKTSLIIIKLLSYLTKTGIRKKEVSGPLLG